MMFDDYVMPTWPIAKIPRYASQIFSYRHVIVPAANIQTNPQNPTNELIKKRVQRASRYWFKRVQELANRELWLPTPGYSAIDVQHASVRRCLYCRPSIVTYRGDIHVKPCGRPEVCPFCAARKAEDMFKRVSRNLRSLKKRQDNVIAVCRIESYPVYAKDFSTRGWDKENVFKNAKWLQEICIAEQRKYKNINRQLKEKTFGSLWRLVIDPTDDGWQIQIRQFFLVRPKAQRPVNRAKKSAAIFLQSAKIESSKDTLDVLGKYVEYPSGLLVSYAELTAAALLAKTGMRLNYATGVLYRKGRVKKPRTFEEARVLPFVP